jgi:hypothetical protein
MPLYGDEHGARNEPRNRGHHQEPKATERRPYGPLDRLAKRALVVELLLDHSQFRLQTVRAGDLPHEFVDRLLLAGGRACESRDRVDEAVTARAAP